MSSQGWPLTAGDATLGVFHPEPQTAGFWAGLARGELLLRRCSDCDRTWHPTQITCRSCGTVLETWVPTTGGGEIFSVSVIHRGTERATTSGPYAVAVIRLDDGPHLLSEVGAEDTHDAAIGARVRVTAEPTSARGYIARLEAEVD